VICKDINDAVDLLTSPRPGKTETFCATEDNRPIAFMFSGMGLQYVNMGRDLYEREPGFRQHMNHCFQILESLVDYDVKEILYPSNGERSEESEVNEGKSPISTQTDRFYNSNKSHNTNTSYINRSEIAQLVIFIFEYSLARSIMKWGITPHAMIGYSFGEYVAACIAGVFSLEDALKLVVLRGQLLQRIPEGAMLSVPLSREEITPYLSSDISLAIDNGSSCIVAGAANLVDDFGKQMKEKGLMCMPVPASHALHTTMMTPILMEFEAIVRTISLNKPQILYISNVTGSWLGAEQALDPSYWSRHLGQTVRFADGMKELLKKQDYICIEIGPGRDIRNLALRYIDDDLKHQVLNLVRHPHQKVADDYFLLNKIGRLWLYGQPIDWSTFYLGQKPKRIPLPTYPFEGQSYWLSVGAIKMKNTDRSKESRLDKKTDMADWFYVPQWTRSVLNGNQNHENSQQQCFLFFTDVGGTASRLAELLRQEGRTVISVGISTGFERMSNQEYRINPRRLDDYHKLFRELAQSNRSPDHIVHSWNASKKQNHQRDIKWNDDILYLGFYSLIFLAKAMAKNHFSNKVQIDVISAYLQEVTGGEELSPERATLLGAVKVLPQEYPNIRCRSIDIEIPSPSTRQEAELVHHLARELSVPFADNVLAYRNNYRWVQTFAPIRLEPPLVGIPKLRNSGVYLITGGLGNLGFSFSQYLVKQ
jgi:acyl transferase domain-containing protein